MKFNALALALALSAAVLPGQLAAQSYSPEAVKKSVSVGDLKAVVSSLGHTVSAEGDFGDTSLTVKTEDGFIYLLIGTACDANGVPGCQGIMMQVRYTLPEGVTYETVAKANLAQAALNTWVDFEDQTLGFTRYQVLDYGVTMANIRENVNVLLDVSAAAYETATGQD